MITMEMLGKVRRLYSRGKKSLHEIAKTTGLSRNTIRKWVRDPGEVAKPTYRRSKMPGKLTAFVPELELALKADAHRTKQNRRTGKALFLQIKAGGYSRVTDFIRAWRDQEGKAPKAFVPLAFELGEAFQFDWSDEGMVVGGIFYKLQVAHLKLCASRAFWLLAYPSQGHEMLFDAHTRAFTALGGIPRRGIYDNMKTAVDKVKKGNPEFKGFSVLEMLEQERLELMPMPSAFDGYVEKPARVSSTCLVSVARNRYTAPCELANHRASTRPYPERVDIAAADTIVASHERLSDRGHIR